MRRITSLAVTLLCLTVTVGAGRDSYPRSAAVDAIHYLINLEFKEASDEIKARAEIVFAFNSDGVKTITLDLAGLVVDGVTENGRPATFTRSGKRLSVALSGNYLRGERCRLAVEYHGRPSDGLFMKQNKFGDRTIFADNWPDRARHWFPGIDHPYDKATVEFVVLAPARYDVIANGMLMETTSKQGGAKLTHWKESIPIPTYCMVVGAAEFSIINAGALAGAGGGTPLHYYLYPKDRDKGIKDYGRAAQMLEFYTGLIGPYPYEKLALVQSSTRFGGMENSSSIFFDEHSIDGDGSIEETVAHEIAHQWFGDSVTEADWHHLWLSEGFATYFENLFFERADGRDKFVSRMLAHKERYLKAYGATSPPVIDPSINDLFKLLNRNNYEKGGWVLHMLRRVVGDEKFFAAIRDYYRAHRDRNALTEDFQRVVEFHAGRDLGWFFKQWLYGPGYPILDAAWRWDAASKELRLRITQKQEKALFRLPLDVAISVGGTTRREVVETTERAQEFTFKLDAKPRAVVIDPDEWVLKVLNLIEER